MKKAIQEPLICINEWVQLCGYRKNQMEIGRVNDLGLACVNPEFFENGLTAGTAAAAAGIIVCAHIPAVTTGVNVAAESAGLAVHNRMGGFSLNGRRLEPQAEVMVSEVKNLLYFMHGNLLPEHQKD